MEGRKELLVLLSVIMLAQCVSAIDISNCTNLDTPNTVYTLLAESFKPCEAIHEQTACQDEGKCLWDVDRSECYQTIFSDILPCQDIGDETLCNLQTQCTWNSGESLCESSSFICFNFLANNVTLDCAGHSASIDGTIALIDGFNESTIQNCIFSRGHPDVSSESFALNATNTQNITITNSAGDCVSFVNVDNVTINYLTATDRTCQIFGASQYAVSLASVNNSLIENSKMSSKVIGDVGVGNNYPMRIDNQSYSNRIFNNYFDAQYFSGQDGCLGGEDKNIYIYFEAGSPINYLNTSRQPGTRIYSPGTEIGGNYYEKTLGCGSFGLPDPEGHSYLCTDSNTDGFCDSPFVLASSNSCTEPYSSCEEVNPSMCSTFGCDYVNPFCNSNGACESQGDEASCLLYSAWGCHWEISSCLSSCLPFNEEYQNCYPYAGACSINGTSCSGTYVPIETCSENNDQSSCEANLCLWNETVTTYDFLPLSNKYFVASGGGGNTCAPGLSQCPDGSCRLDCNPLPPPPSQTNPIDDLSKITILGIRLTIWLLLLAILIMTFDYEVIGKGKKFSVLGVAGFFLFTFALVIELIPLLSGRGTL